ncbi:MAG: hypothetical protein ABL953_04940 [Ilumatobacteraceae bacterium]
MNGATGLLSRRVDAIRMMDGAQSKRLANIAHIVTLAVAAGWILFTSRRQWFFGDEWAFFINRREQWAAGHEIDAVMLPHNEHWTALPAVLFFAMFKLFGLHSYLLYLLPVVAAHLAAAFSLRLILIRIGVGNWASALFVTPFAFFGAGAENLTWAFQIAFVGAVSFGLVLLLLVSNKSATLRRDLLAITAGVGALMCSGMGIPFVVAAAVVLVIDRSWLRLIRVVAPIAVIFGLWYLIWGSDSSSGLPPASLKVVPRFVWTGSTATLEGLTQLRGIGAVILVGCVVVLCLKPPQHALVLGCAAGAASMFVLTALGRAGLGQEQATASRYTYIAGALLLPVVVAALRTATATQPRAWLVAVVFTSWAAVGNAADMSSFTQARYDVVNGGRRRIEAAASLRDLALIDPNAVPDPTYNPNLTAGALRALVESGKLDVPDELPTQDVLSAAAALLVHVGPVAAPPETSRGDVTTSAPLDYENCVFGTGAGVTLNVRDAVTLQIQGWVGAIVQIAALTPSGEQGPIMAFAIQDAITPIEIYSTEFPILLVLPEAVRLCGIVVA